MSENSNSNVKDVIEAATGLVKAVPIYDDALKPAAKELGKSFLTIVKVINVALAPISALVWGYEKIEDFINERLADKLENVLEENIITPDPAIVGPSLEALRFSGNNEELREMYANLIANSMDSTTANKTHPGFVEIIKNMNSEEAKILNYISPNSVIPIINIKSKSSPDEDGSVSVYEHLAIFDFIETNTDHNLIPSYLDNLQRLGLIQIDYGRYLTDESRYDKLFSNNLYKQYESIIAEQSKFIYSDKGMLTLTSLGKQFRSICIIEK